MSDGHTLLLVEDDPDIARVLEEICGSLGCQVKRAATLAEVRAAADAGGYCGVLLDLQIPAFEHAKPLVGSGETALALLRKLHPRRAEGCHALPIIAVTGYSVAPDFVMRLARAGVDEFIPKSFGDGAQSFAERMEGVLDKIRTCLSLAGRADHAACAELASPSPPAALPSATLDPGGATLEIGGEKAQKRAVVIVNGARRELQPRLFAALLRLALEHERDRDAWWTYHEIGIAKTPDVPKRIRDALNSALPMGFDILETKYGGNCRLYRDAHVVIDRRALAEDPEPRVRELLAKRGTVKP